jgi:uncharacterized protein
MTNGRFFFAFLFFLCFAGRVCTAQDNKPPLPKQGGLVNDFEDDLDLGTVALLKDRMAAHNAKNGDNVVVASIKNYANFSSLKDYSVELAGKWNIGLRGVLITFSQAKNEVYIEPGLSLQKKLAPNTCEYIIRNKILPKFITGNYDQGIIDGVNEIIKVLDAP